MKTHLLITMKSFVLMTVYFGSSQAFAQWSTNGSNVYYSGGSVGIGTNLPSNIQGWDKVLDVAGVCCSKIIATSSLSSCRVGTYAHSSWYGGGGFMGTESNHNLFFITNYDPKMVITTAGKVGLGTLSPSTKLDVNGDFQTYPSGNAGVSGALKVRIVPSATGSTIEANSDLVWSNHDITINGANTAGGNLNQLVVHRSGNVGIGTSTPDAKLVVNGDVRLSGLSNKLVVGTPGVPSDYLLLQDVGTGAAFQWVQDGSPKFSIEGVTGNVGIGTTTPDAKLAVKGQIHAQEVKVDLNGAVAPDYVFASNYQLPTLDYIKTYIDQNKHLPEVPSAKEMETNGVKLGEMNMLLLKKIEELTLYVIELKKRDEAQQLEIEQLKIKK